MKPKIILLLLLLFFKTKSEAQVKSIFNQKSWVFIVGVLEFEDKENLASFDKRGRVDAQIVKHFESIGVPKNQILYIKDKQAYTDNLKGTFNEFIKKAQKDDNLFFYYSGHGYRNSKSKICLASYSGDDWTVNDIVRDVNQNFKGNTVFFTADCCLSGGLSEEAQKYKTKNFISLNSVVPSDLSTGNWTFSKALLYALQGKNYADLNNNSKIELSELVQYLDEEMAMVEEQKTFSYIPKNTKDMIITSNVPKKKHPRIGERVYIDYDGENYLGFITSVNSENQFNIRYYSYTNNETDWVEMKDMKPYTCSQNFSNNTKVKVYSTIDEKWLPAEVKKKFYCLHYIHYEGYGTQWDEWVPTDRIKARK
jgi:hypothetical protein